MERYTFRFGRFPNSGGADRNAGFALHLDALDLVERHNFAFYDALMVAAALRADSKVFFSEDMQDGLIVEGRLEIVNPFASRLHA